ncbi:MAG TPA: hypothetical protein VN771_04985 [Candidatus Baltobacteraceae bacterium]|nr:hypothetical protein [Candidatus Baltobacteraceae bacterium]
MRIDRSRFGWGLFLVLVGLVPLAVAANILDGSTVRQAWQLWPLVLVGLGVGLLLGRARGALISTLVVSISLGLATGGLLAGAGGGVLAGGACSPGGTGGAAPDGTLTSGMKVTIQGGCGDLHVTAQAGDTWQATGDAIGDLKVDTGPQSIRIRPGGDLLFNGRDTLTVALPTDPQLDLDLKAGLGDLSVALPGAHLGSLQADVSFGSGVLDLSGATLTGTLDGSFSFGSGTVILAGGTYSGTLSSSFGSLDVCAPPGVAVHVTAHSGLGSVDVGEGFDAVGDGWQTTGYATAAQRADLHLATSFGSLSVTRGTCG